MDAPPPSRAKEQAALWALAGVVLCLLAYRAYSPRFGFRPSDTLPPATADAGVDLNVADRTELLQVPGFGPALADAVMAYRQGERFAHVDDLEKVPGIGAKTVEKVRPWVKVGPPEPLTRGQAPDPPVETLSRKHVAPPTGRVNVNAASEPELDGLPGIGPVLAKRIIAEREKKPFAAIEDLRRVPGIGPKTLEKLRPHVVFE